MERLKQSDFRTILDFVTDCYAIREAQSFERFVEHLVNVLPSLIPAEHVTYNEMNPQRAESHNCVNTEELATPEAATLWEQHMNEHPVLEHVLRTGDCRAVRISDFWTRGELHSCGLYSDFYRALGIEDALCANLMCDSPRVVGIGLHRQSAFSDRELLIFELVRPHILQAWRNAKAVSQAQNEMKLFARGMEEAHVGAIVCDADGRIRFATALARRHLVEYFGAREQIAHLLPDELLRWLHHQTTQLLKADVPSVRLPLVRQRDNNRLVVSLLSENGANFLLLEEKIGSVDKTAIHKYHLTRRESEVLDWVAQGKTNSEIAAILHMTVGTVKKHVEHIFQKLGVETRTAAAALVLSDASHLPPSR